MRLLPSCFEKGTFLSVAPRMSQQKNAEAKCQKGHVSGINMTAQPKSSTLRGPPTRGAFWGQPLSYKFSFASFQGAFWGQPLSYKFSFASFQCDSMTV